VVLDNHSAHISKETHSYVATKANIYLPKHPPNTLRLRWIR